MNEFFMEQKERDRNRLGLWRLFSIQQLGGRPRACRKSIRKRLLRPTHWSWTTSYCSGSGSVAGDADGRFEVQRRCLRGCR